ncbi:MAG: molybdate ABC transporter substrate-binding protein [SAR202 cluster bacterium]|nr:molybdate ABC transporter substrate-binding protein [SAR202 cluster bacterium]
MRALPPLAIALLVSLAATACGAPTTTPSTAAAGPTERVEIVVGIAASLEPVMRELGAAFEQRHTAKVVFVVGSSGTLSTQIERGAPVDVFAPAHTSFLDRLAGKSLVRPETVRTYAEGGLALLASGEAASAADWRSAMSAAGVRHIAIANPETAPYGDAAKAALERAGLWVPLRPKVVQGENVAQVLQFVTTGNADVGFVARSQVMPGVPPRLRVFDVPNGLHSPLPHGIAIVGATPRRAAAERFVEFIASHDAQPTLERYGYSLPRR